MLLSSISVQILPKPRQKKQFLHAKRDCKRQIKVSGAGLRPWCDARRLGRGTGKEPTKQDCRRCGLESRGGVTALGNMQGALNAHARGSLKPPALRLDPFPRFPLDRATTDCVCRLAGCWPVLRCVLPCSCFECMAMDAPFPPSPEL